MNFSAELYQTESFDDLWGLVLKPWLESIQRRGLMQKPSAVLLPHPSWEACIKRAMVRHSLSGFNLHFLTPGKVRNLIQCAFPYVKPKVSVDGLHCVAAALACKSTVGYSRSVYFSPESFVRAHGKCVVSGCSLAEFLPSFLDAWLKDWEAVAGNLGSVQQADREALQALIKQKHQIYDELLIAGFTGRDWGLYPFLLSALCLARKTVVSLPLVRDGMHEELWQGTWEHLLGSAVPVAGDFERATDDASQAVEFLLSRTIVQEAEYVSKRALVAAALGDFVAIVVPRSGGLSREIARYLGAHGVAHYSGFDYDCVACAEGRLLEVWLRFSRECTLESFINLLRESDTFDLDLIAAVSDILERAFCDLLINDVRLLKTYALKQYTLTDRVRQALDFFPFPCVEDVFSNYLNCARSVVEACVETEDLFSEGETLASVLRDPIPHTVFLDWLEARAKKCLRVRSACTNQPFSNIYLLSAEQADGLSFDTVILAGLNVGQWTGKSSSSLFEPESLIGSKNRKNTIQGNRGEGHHALRFPYGYILTTEDELREARARQERLAQSARKATILSASMTSEDDFKLYQPLDDFFQVHYKKICGDYLREPEFPGLVQKTENCLGKDLSGGKKDHPLIQSAYRARYNADALFGPYEYTFDPSDVPSFSLSCSQWERAIKHPSDIWYEILACARPERTYTAASMRNQARGIWVHRWLVFFKNNAELKAIPSEKLWRACVQEESDQFRQSVFDVYNMLDKSVPDWWCAEWYRARGKAFMLMSRVLDVNNYTFFAQEISLPTASRVALPSEKNIQISGRMDLILSNQAGNFQRLGECAADFLVVDFKTGLQSSLSAKKLEKGEGLQLALYAEALHTLGAASVGISVFGTRGKSKSEPQLTLKDVSQLEGVWHFMELVQFGGVLGQRNQVRERFNSGGSFPIATLGIPKAVLDSKWRTAHPNIGS